MTRPASRRIDHPFLRACLLGAAVPAAHTDAGWFESGDVVLRGDLHLLNNAGMIRLPVNGWPLPRAAVCYALVNAREGFATAAVLAALGRVRARVDDADASHRGQWRGEAFDISVVTQSYQPDTGRTSDGIFGFVQWTRRFRQ